MESTRYLIALNLKYVNLALTKTELILNTQTFFKKNATLIISVPSNQFRLDIFIFFIFCNFHFMYFFFTEWLVRGVISGKIFFYVFFKISFGLACIDKHFV
jgi:hypothetical protein